MKYRKQIITAVFCSIGILMIILDSKQATLTVQDAITFCMYTVIPALFPMSILTSLLTSQILGKKTFLSNVICSICKLQPGSESIYLTGLISGYPLGAKNTALAYSSGSITKKQAEDLLAFCNNAGPAFIFGMCPPLFSTASVCWLIWLIQIISSIMVANTIPQSKDTSKKISTKPITLQTAIAGAIRSMAAICGWIVLFKLLISFLDKWVLFIFPDTTRAIIFSLLESANGIASLSSIPSEGMRFIICCVSLSFGGVCVLMQTSSMIGNLNISKYITGKTVQAIYSLALAVGAYYFHYILNATILYTAIFLASPLLILPILQKTVEIVNPMIYNTNKCKNTR